MDRREFHTEETIEGGHASDTQGEADTNVDKNKDKENDEDTDKNDDIVCSLTPTGSSVDRREFHTEETIKGGHASDTQGEADTNVEENDEDTDNVEEMEKENGESAEDKENYENDEDTDKDDLEMEKARGENSESAEDNENDEDTDKDEKEGENSADYNEKIIENNNEDDQTDHNNLFFEKIKKITKQLNDNESTEDQIEGLLLDLIKITPFETMTVPIISETGIGKIVRKIEKTAERSSTRTRAARLVNRWKKIIFVYEGSLLPKPSPLSFQTPPHSSQSNQIEITPPPSDISISVSSPELEPATKVALAKLRKVQKEERKRKRELDDTIDEEESDSKRKCFLNISAIQNSTPDISKLQVTLGAGRTFIEEHNSTPVNKNLNDEMDAKVTEKEHVRMKPSVKNKCPTCDQLFKRLASHTRHCKGKTVV